MQKQILNQMSKPRKKETLSGHDRRDKDRRKVEGEGYTYVPVVGWVCRRDQYRRKDNGNLRF